MKKAPSWWAGPVKRRGRKVQRALTRDTLSGVFLVLPVVRIIVVNM